MSFAPSTRSTCARARQPPSEGPAAEEAQRERAGIGGLARLVRGGAEDVVEDHRAHPAVDMTWRSLVGGAQNEVRMHRAVRAVVNGQGRCDGIAKPDDDVAPRDRLTVRCRSAHRMIPAPANRSIALSPNRSFLSPRQWPPHSPRCGWWHRSDGAQSRSAVRERWSSPALSRGARNLRRWWWCAATRSPAQW